MRQGRRGAQDEGIPLPRLSQAAQCVYGDGHATSQFALTDMGSRILLDVHIAQGKLRLNAAP